MKELVAAEKKILGHSSIEESANLAVFAVPVMEFEEGGLHTSASRIAGSIIANDPLVLKHTQVGAVMRSHARIMVGVVVQACQTNSHYSFSYMQAMGKAIEAIRADRLAKVQIMDSQKFHSLRRTCLGNMIERAMMLDASVQDVVIDGINRTEDIVRPVHLQIAYVLCGSFCLRYREAHVRTGRLTEYELLMFVSQCRRFSTILGMMTWRIGASCA